MTPVTSTARGHRAPGGAGPAQRGLHGGGHRSARARHRREERRPRPAEHAAERAGAARGRHRGGQPGKRRQRCGWCRRSSSARGRRSRRLRAQRGEQQAHAPEVEHASARDSEAGSTAPPAVEPLDLRDEHHPLDGRWHRQRTTPPRVLAGPTEKTRARPAGRRPRCPGWPSARVASSEEGIAVRVTPPASTLPGHESPIQAAALEPSHGSGMRFTQRSATPRNGRSAPEAMRTARATTLRSPVSSRPAPFALDGHGCRRVSSGVDLVVAATARGPARRSRDPDSPRWRARERGVGCGLYRYSRFSSHSGVRLRSPRSSARCSSWSRRARPPR